MRTTSKPANQYARIGMIRECAGLILKQLATGEQVDLISYRPHMLASAYKLLLFEGFIRTKAEFRLSEQGKYHVSKNGYLVYPPLDTTKNPL